MKFLLRVMKWSLITLSAYLFAVRPWHVRWGAFTAEVDERLPGDDLIPNPVTTSTRAVTIHASASEIWPWLVQMGQGRGGFYSYDWLENLFDLDIIYSADHIIPEEQALTIGDIVPLAPRGGPTMAVAEIEPDRALVLRAVEPDTWRPIDRARESFWDFSWAFILEPIDAKNTRLIVRGRGDARPAMVNSFNFILEPIQFVMERKMLLGIKHRAEQAHTHQDVASITQSGTLLDDVLPDAEFKDMHAITIHASHDQIFRAFREVTLADMPIARWMGELRYLPGRIMGKDSDETQDNRPFLDIVLESGNIELAERPNQEHVIGVIGKLHQVTNQEFVPLEDAAAFASFAAPDYQKLVQSVRIADGDETAGYKVIYEHRTHGLSPAARRKFALYWMVIKPSSALLVKMMLAAVKRRAEAMAQTEYVEYAEDVYLAPIIAYP